MKRKTKPRTNITYNKRKDISILIGFAVILLSSYLLSFQLHQSFTFLRKKYYKWDRTLQIASFLTIEINGVFGDHKNRQFYSISFNCEHSRLYTATLQNCLTKHHRKEISHSKTSLQWVSGVSGSATLKYYCVNRFK